MTITQRDLAKEEFWRGVVARHAASGLSVRLFCRQERLTESAFYAWRRTLSEREAMRATTDAPPAFVPAVVINERSAEQAIILELRSGNVLRWPQSLPVAQLAELVRALEQRGAS